MDFDEYEYLEKMAEDPEVKEVVNGSEEKKKKDENRSSKHRSDGKENDVDNPSKHSKSGEKSHDQDRVGSSRRRSRSRDGERDRLRNDPERKDREKARDKHRDRDERDVTGGRERYRDPDGERNRRDHDRNGERGRGRGRETEKEKEQFQSFRSRSDRPEGGKEDTDRDINRDKEREKFHDRGFRGDNRRHREKKEERTEQPADPERDQRTVFAYQIHLKADEKDVYEFFTRAGKVRDVHLITDRITKRSKGVGYIEFYDSMSVPMAIALSGQPLRGMPVMVKPSEAEKNLIQPTPASAGGAGGTVPPGGARKLYVGNLHSDLTSDQLKKIFEPFGEVELVQLPLDQSGNCQGFGFVQFARLEDAQSGLSLNGLEIAGRTIKVSAVTDQPGAQNAVPTSGDFDDDDGSLTLNASSRAILMQRLDRSGTALSTAGFNGTVGQIYGSAPVVSSTAATVPVFGEVPFTGLQVPSVTAAPTVDPIGVPSGCLLLKNMFDPSLESELDFDLDIKEDVQEECSKYGKLKHIHVDKNSSGFVYLRFESTESAVGAQRALHGRWFAGKMITATYMVPLDYESKFPESG